MTSWQVVISQNTKSVRPFDAEVHARHEQMGRPIGPYNEMIAGHARSQGLVVVTNNTKQF